MTMRSFLIAAAGASALLGTGIPPGTAAATGTGVPGTAATAGGTLLAGVAVTAGDLAAVIAGGKNVGFCPLKICHWSHNRTMEKPNITHKMVRRMSFMTVSF
jgi:hypothetical protein